MADLADPRFLDERIAHWAETKPDERSVHLLRPDLDLGAVERPGPPAGRRADRARRQARRRGGVPRQEPPGLCRADVGRGVAGRGQRDHQLPAGRRRTRLRAQRLRRQAADRRRGVQAGNVDKIRDKLTNVEHVIEVTPEGEDGDEYEAMLAAATPTEPRRRRRPRRRRASSCTRRARPGGPRAWR